MKLFASTQDTLIASAAKNGAAVSTLILGMSIGELMGLVSVTLAGVYSALNIFFLLKDRYSKRKDE